MARKPRPPEPPLERRKPPKAKDDPDALAPWTFEPIGVVRSPYTYVHDAPRQGAGAANAPAEIVLKTGMQNCLRDLAGFDRVWVVFVFNYSNGWNEMVIPPRDTTHRGVLATRAPHRPNPIGLTCARIISVKARTVTIDEHDLLDGTPVLDLKPYLPYADAHPAARAGWTDSLPPGAPDHRWE